MTVEEVRKLAQLEMDKKLPLPKNIITNDENEQQRLADFMNIVYCLFGTKRHKTANLCDFICKYADSDEEIDEYNKQLSETPKKQVMGLLTKLAIKKTGVVEDISGSGTIEDQYILKTKYGEGKMFDARYLFQNKKWPKCLKVHECYENSRVLVNFASRNNNWEVKQQTGIIFDEYTYLHSIVCIQTPNHKWVLDSNYHLMMSYDLYVKLMSFEVLNEVSSEEILNEENTRLLQLYNDLCQEKGLAFNFALPALAHQDIIDRTKKYLQACENANDLIV